jgi:TRAP-type C4-dicarboxylate transport system permease small subunit
MPVVKRFFAAFGLLLDGIIGLLLLAVVTVILAQVTVRYVIGGSMPWGEELSRLLFVWMVMLGAVKAGHMRIEYFADRFPPRLRVALDILLALLSVAILVLMVRGAWSLIELTAFDRYVALGLPVKYLFLALFCAGLLWIPVIVARAIAGLRTRL